MRRMIDNEEIKIKLLLLLFLGFVGTCWNLLKAFYLWLNPANVASIATGLTITLIVYVIYDFVQKIIDGPVSETKTTSR